MNLNLRAKEPRTVVVACRLQVTLGNVGPPCLEACYGEPPRNLFVERLPLVIGDRVEEAHCSAPIARERERLCGTSPHPCSFGMAPKSPDLVTQREELVGSLTNG